MSFRNYAAITDLDELRAYIDRITGNVFGFDIETGYHGPDREKASVRPETAIVVGVSFTDSLDWARYVPLAHDTGDNLDPVDVAPLLWELLATGLGVAHNAVFELRHLASFFRRYLADHPVYGEQVRASKGYYPIRSDTQVEAYLAADFERFGLKPLTLHMFDRTGNAVPSSEYRHRAREIATLNQIKDLDTRKAELAKFDGHIMTELHELFPDLQVNRRKFLRFNTLELTPKVIDYACEDSLWCLAIHQHYYERISKMLLYAVEMAIVRHVVPAMEDFGVAYDWSLMRQIADFLKDFRDKYNAEVMGELSELAGEPIAIKLSSPPQLSKVLFDKLGYRTNVYTDKTRDLQPSERKMSTGKIALERLAQKHPVVQRIREWREMTRLLGTYLEKYETVYNYADDGRAHPNHLSAFVITGRFAVGDPPYQQCLPGSYEVLTPGGWVRLDQLPDGVPVIQYSDSHGLEEGVVEFVTPSEVTRNAYHGDMIEFRSGEGGNWRYTPNHRIMYRLRRRNKKTSRPTMSEIREVTAEQWEASLLRQIPGEQGRRLHDRYMQKGGWKWQGILLTEEEERSLRLAVAVQADGSRTAGNQYDISVYKDRKVQALREMGLEPEQQSRGRWRVRVPVDAVSRWLDDTKNFRADAILAMRVDGLRHFVREVMQWDGDATRGCTYQQKSSARRQSVDVVQAAACLAGHGTSLYKRPDDDAVTVNVHRYPIKGFGWQEPARVPSDGMVYCVTVPSGMFLCRNDQGKVMVTGNSPKKYHIDLNAAKDVHAAHVEAHGKKCSCADPQFEPPPGTCFKFNFRDVITAPPGYYILGFDLSQAELRAIAGEAREIALLDAFERGVDVHRLTASLMLGVPVEEVTEAQRDVGKTMAFALGYGMSVQSLADRLGVPIEEAQVLYDKYFAAYPAIPVWSQRQVEHGKKFGYVTSKFGRKLPIWEYFSDKRWIYQKGDRACVNYPIQGAATGDLVKIMMVRAVDAIAQAGYADKMHLVMNIHDALEFYVDSSIPPADAVAVLRDAIIFPIPGWPPMRADWHIARRWGSPTKIDVNDDGSVLVHGDQTFELRPSVEIDEETGEEVEELPEISPEIVKEIVRLQGRHVVVTLDAMPPADGWRTFVDALHTSPGDNTVTVSTLEGDITLGFTCNLSPSHADKVRALLGCDADVSYVTDLVEAADL